ncbi:MAG TPA: SH3 domain-containing protein [Devosia sp.]
MSSVGFPIFVVTTLLAGTAAAIVLTPKDILRSTVVKAPAPAYVERFQAAADLHPRTIQISAPTVQMASLTVSVTPLPEAERQPVAAPEAARDLRRITAGVLNMRSEPNKNAELIASLPRGTQVEVFETSGTWAYVRAADGSTGWLSQNFLARAE